MDVDMAIAGSMITMTAMIVTDMRMRPEREHLKECDQFFCAPTITIGVSRSQNRSG